MMTTFYRKEKLKECESVDDKALNQLFQDIRSIYKNKYYVKSRKFYKREGFKKISGFVYELLIREIDYKDKEPDIDSFWVFNFPRDQYEQKRMSSINPYADRALIMCYFYGVLNTYHENNPRTP